MKYRIKENSLIAKIAAAKLKSGSAAIVIGNTIHLHQVSEKDFLKNEKWVKHEMCHIRQFKKFGFFKFIYQYLRESASVGYYNNRFEVEARKAESE